jgi:hypothetical protein
MSVTPSPIGGFAAQFFDNNGVILSGGKIYTYAAGTTTPQASYTSAAGVTPHANPIILDSAGRVPGGEIWLTDGLVYKFVIETATAILIGTYDNITGVNSNFINYTVQEEVITATAGQTVFDLSTINYTPGTNSLTVYIDGVNQYVGDSYLETDSDTVTFTSGVHVGGEVKFTTAIQTTTGAVDASIVSYEPPFANSVATTVEDKLAQYVSVKDFGAVGDNVTDDTAAIQAALDTGLNVDLVGGQYKAANLTMITDVQSLFSSQGFARITKNANGPILTISADDALIENVGFRGEASSPIFTGDNVVVTGDAVTFNNCGSRWAYARALKISGNTPSIIGSGDIWQTADATASGYDIEIANASTTIAYPQLISIVSSQSTGGILLTNTGSHVLSAGQIGKLTINTAGGPPAGINGGMTTNMRILGDVTVAQSSGRFVGNQFGAVVVTLSAGTSGISIDQSNSFQTGSTAVNSGNSNNVIVRQTSGGSFNTFKFGPDASNATMDVYSANGDTGQFGFHNGVWVNNNKTFGAKDSGGTIQNLAYISTGNSNFFGNSNGDTVLTGNTLLILAAAGNGRWGVEANYLYPRADNAYSLGLASFRPTVLYAVSGTINTSDGREKQQIRDLDATEKLVALRCKQIIKTYKWNEAVAKKGDDARIHIGVIAQEVEQAFAAEGLDADKYGLFCYDEWEAKEEEVDEETGFVIQPALKAGNRYGVRLDQLLAFIIGAL